ncbi:carboxypeptidase regulatory-like domain-containing protein [Nitrospira sp. Kam-Ns4a]
MKATMTTIIGILAGAAAAFAFGAGTALAYEEVTVSDGGTLTGTVTLVGQVPKPKGYNLTTLPDPVYCGRISDGRGWRLLQPFNVGDGGAFRDVVVFIEGIDRGKPFAFQTPRIEAIDCTFKPFIVLVRDKQEVTVVNMDPTMHDIQAYETSHLGPRVLFNVPLPMNPHHPREGINAQYHRHLPGQPMTQTVNMTKGRRVFVMQCGFHAYMESWGLLVDNPYYAISDREGRFTIGDIPPGTYKVVVWHPYIGGMVEQTVTIEARGRTTLEIAVPAPTGRLYANQMVDNPYVRYNVTEVTQSQIVPTLERQSY